MLAAVEQTLSAVNVEDEPLIAASCELARAYAHQLDQAAAIRRAADKALRTAQQGDDETLIEQITALRAKLGERDTVVQVGAKLHALLAELQATPKARVARSTAITGGALSKLRAVK